MTDVYVLHHTIKRSDHDNSKLIGVYTTEEQARRAIERLTKKPGFRDPDGAFSIDRYRLDEDNWTEGFGLDG